MPGGVCYLCEYAGARILALSDGVTQVGTEYQVLLETWDELPLEESGEVFFRTIDITLEFTNGYNIGVTPVVDGADLAEQLFQSSGTGVYTVAVPVKQRGTRIGAKVRTISRSGQLYIENIVAQVVPVRSHR